jgi:hypothetical protein
MGKTKEMARIRLELARIWFGDNPNSDLEYIFPKPHWRSVKYALDFINKLHNAPYPQVYLSLYGALLMKWEGASECNVWIEKNSVLYANASGSQRWNETWIGHIPTRLLTAIRNTKRLT